MSKNVFITNSIVLKNREMAHMIINSSLSSSIFLHAVHYLGLGEHNNVELKVVLKITTPKRKTSDT